MLSFKGKIGKSFTLLFMLLLLFCCVSFWHGSLAQTIFSTVAITTVVKIDGYNFGRFDNVSGLSDFMVQDGKPSNIIVNLSRVFITEPSLYNYVRSGRLSDITLEYQSTINSKVLYSHKLMSSKPIAMMLEANPYDERGGFRESLRFSVQEVRVE